MEIPLFSYPISAVFPSPAADFVEKSLDLNVHLIKHPAATFFVRVEGDSMKGSGIHSGDILIVDKSLQPANNSIVIATINGDFVVKRLKKEGGRIYLMPENPLFNPISVEDGMQVEVWGCCVTWVAHKASQRQPD